MITLTLYFSQLKHDTILTLSTLKVFTDNKFNVAQIGQYFIDRVDNNVGKGENAGYQHFLLFPQCFSKGFTSRIVKSRDCVVMSDKVFLVIKVPIAAI